MSALIIDALDEAVDDLVPLVGAKAACAAVGLPRASYYRTRPASQPAAVRSRSGGCEEPGEASPPEGPPRHRRPQQQPQQQPRALSGSERAQVLEVLHSPL